MVWFITVAMINCRWFSIVTGALRGQLIVATVIISSQRSLTTDIIREYNENQDIIVHRTSVSVSWDGNLTSDPFVHWTLGNCINSVVRINKNTTLSFHFKLDRMVASRYRLKNTVSNIQSGPIRSEP